MVYNALVAGGRLLGAEQQAMRPGWGKLCEMYVRVCVSFVMCGCVHLWVL